MSKPYSINVFMPTGDPAGIRTIEKSNWSGVGIVIPRPLLGEAKSYEDMKRPGVYVLIGPPEGSGLPRIYVGEGDPIRPRLEQHDSKKDFWTSCFAFTSTSNSLNKAHVQFIESRLVLLARQARRCVLENSNDPALPTISAANAADAQGFLDEMLLCLPLLGLNVFLLPEQTRRTRRAFFISGKGISAEGFETSSGFTVIKDSTATTDETPSCPSYICDARAALLNNGVLKANGKLLAFTQDFEFASPTAAASAILGMSVNGREKWVTREGTALRDLSIDS